MPVKLGTENSVPVVLAEEKQLLVEKGQLQQVNIRTELEETVTAPVSRGQRLGTMTVTVGEQVLAQIPLVAGSEVAKLTWWQLFRQTLQKICLG